MSQRDAFDAVLTDLITRLREPSSSGYSLAPASLGGITVGAFSKAFEPRSKTQADNEPMTDITRDELFSKMDSQSSKLDARLAEMRADMAVSRREMSEQIGRVAESVAEIRGSVDGIKTSMGMLQWCIGTVGLVGGIWIAYQQLKLAEVPPVASVAAAAPFQMPPIIINVPASVAPPAAAPAPK